MFTNNPLLRPPLVVILKASTVTYETEYVTIVRRADPLEVVLVAPSFCYTTVSYHQSIDKPEPYRTQSIAIIYEDEVNGGKG